MNKKGFTLIELITTFALATVIIILLINVVVVIKNIYTNNNIKSELLIEQSNLSNLMNKKFSKDMLDSYIPCNDSDFCYEFNFVDGSISKLVVSDEFIKFDAYVYKLKNSIKTHNPTLETIIDIDVSTTDANDSFLIINIPIKHKLYPNKNYGINLVYQYNSTKVEL